MLTLEIRLLTGRYAAASVTDPASAEWPPHPARVYSALTAALHEEAEPAADEVRALDWLAEMGAPEIHASPAEMRWLGSIFVPTNDQKALADIDSQLERVEAAERALHGTEGKERARAEKALEKARSALLARSATSAEADGTGTPSNAAELLNRRLRPQPRRFPVAVPHDEVVHLQWPVAPTPDILAALDRVAARVARLGHSSSLVSLRVLTEPVDVGERRRWIPSEEGSRFLRVPLPGQLERLRSAHARHLQVEQRVLPAEQVRYLELTTREEVHDLPAVGVFSQRDEEWIVFEVIPPAGGERRMLLDISLAQQVARAMRGTLFRHIDPTRSPEALTGHRAEGAPATAPHLAYVPLADVGFPHSSGSILGLALIPPADFGVRARDLLIEAIRGAELEAARSSGSTPGAGSEPPPLRLTLGRHGVLQLRRLRQPAHRRSLQPARWTGPARRWYTATAVALGRNPGDLHARDPERATRAVEAAERTIAADCVNIGLPEPAAVWIHRRSLLNGAPAATRFMPFPEQGNGPRRVCVHAEVLFERPVRGPVLLGAGRYFGVGLCAPAREA
jgi:CRISPR-associated protein Csb2